MPRGRSSMPRARGAAAKGALSGPTVRARRTGASSMARVRGNQTRVGRPRPTAAQVATATAQQQSKNGGGINFATNVSPITGRRLTPPSAEQSKKARSILGKYR